MGKMTRGEFISRLEKLNKDTDWDKAYKFFERQSGTRVETNKEVLRNSWVFDVAWHVYHGVGTTKEIKSTTQKIRNYVKNQHYKDNYKLFMGHDWKDLTAIKKGKDPVEQHVKNCNAILQSALGKKLMKDLIDNGGSFIEVDGQGPMYLRKLKEEYKRPIPGLKLEDWGDTKDFSNDPEYLKDKKEMSKNKKKKK
jgi:hypothetical protein|tara:strand:+ start:920 stop:1504 length:585 start_codon:yes stop_codon:yes gene_type:complete